MEWKGIPFPSGRKETDIRVSINARGGEEEEGSTYSTHNRRMSLTLSVSVYRVTRPWWFETRFHFIEFRQFTHLPCHISPVFTCSAEAELDRQRIQPNQSQRDIVSNYHGHPVLSVCCSCSFRSPKNFFLPPSFQHYTQVTSCLRRHRCLSHVFYETATDRPRVIFSRHYTHLSLFLTVFVPYNLDFQSVH